MAIRGESDPQFHERTKGKSYDNVSLSELQRKANEAIIMHQAALSSINDIFDETAEMIKSKIGTIESVEKGGVLSSQESSANLWMNLDGYMLREPFTPADEPKSYEIITNTMQVRKTITGKDQPDINFAYGNEESLFALHASLKQDPEVNIELGYFGKPELST